MDVREAELEDVRSIVEIENEAIAITFAHFGTQPVRLEDAEEHWRGHKDRYPWLVAVTEEVVGFARASMWKPRDAYSRTVEIGVYVRPSAQGMGVASAMYEVLFPLLRQLGCHTVLAGIAIPNEASVRLHERFGMRHVGTLPQVGFKMGEWRDVGYWACTLDDYQTRATE
jgi:phosphinothricin acetyltransferase